MRELSRSTNRKPLNRVKAHSNMHGCLITWKLKEKEVSPSISPSGSSKPTNITTPLLMLLDTEISSRIWLPVPHKLMLLFSWLPPLKESLKLVSQRTDKPENTDFSLTPWVLNKWSSALTRWTTRQSVTDKLDMKKLPRKLPNTWRKLDTTLLKSHSSQFLDGLEITCSRDHQTSHGTRDLPFLKLWIQLIPQRDPLINHSDYHYRMSTRSVVSELSQSEELKPVSLSPAWLLFSLPLDYRVKLNPSKCITKLSLKLNQETMLDSMLNLSQLKNSREDMSALTQRMIPLVKRTPSPLRSSLLTTLDKSETDIPPSLIATPPTLPASSLKSNQRMTEELVKSLKRNPNSSRLVMPLWSS